MRIWLARFAWWLLGFRVLPITPGSVLVATIDVDHANPELIGRSILELKNAIRSCGGRLIVVPTGLAIDRVIAPESAAVAR